MLFLKFWSEKMWLFKKRKIKRFTKNKGVGNIENVNYCVNIKTALEDINL